MLKSITVSFCAIIFLCGLPALAVVNGKVHSAFEKPEVLRIFQFLKDPSEVSKLKDIGRWERNSEGQCTAVAINHYQALTAGHCVVDEKGKPFQNWLLNWKTDGSWQALQAIRIQTQYQFEDLEPKPIANALVPGCTNGIQVPVPLSKTKDLAILSFPAKTFSKWALIGAPKDVKLGTPLQIFGYGVHQDRTNGGKFLNSTPRVNDLRGFSSQVKRMNHQRWAIMAEPQLAFADEGDSGAPAFLNGYLVGIVSTVQPKCETEFGEDYQIMNSITKVHHQFPWLLEENNQSVLLR